MNPVLDTALAFARRVPRAFYIGMGLALAVVAGVVWALSNAKESGRNEIRTAAKIERADSAVRGAELGKKSAEIVSDETSILAAKRRKIDQETDNAIESIRVALGAEAVVHPDLSRRGICAIVRLRAQAGELSDAELGQLCDRPEGRAQEPLRPQGAASR